MTSIEPSRFDDGRAMLLGGVRRDHSFAGMAESVPAQWQAFNALGTLPGQQGTTAYGVICTASPEAQTLEYMCGAEVAAFDALPPDLGRMRIPAQHYAVFEHRGHVSTIRETWDAIWNDWLPRSGYVPVDGPEFAVYDDRFDVRTGTGGIEIWSPVQPRD